MTAQWISEPEGKRAAQPQVKKRGRPAHPRQGVTIIVSRRLLWERLSAASAAAWYGIPGQRLIEPTRGEARIACARQAAMYFAHVFFRANLTRAGGIFGRDRTTARHACNCVEDKRDDARFDKACGVLEPAMRAWLAHFGEVPTPGGHA